MGRRVRQTIRARIPKLNPCYGTALARKPTLAGTARLEIRIQPDGKVVDVKITSPLGPDVTRCLRGKVERWRFGAIPKATRYPFNVRFTSR